jgi:hypothetical protein
MQLRYRAAPGARLSRRQALRHAKASKCSAARPDALLFDCDGVLVDTEKDGHRVAFNKAFAERGTLRDCSMASNERRHCTYHMLQGCRTNGMSSCMANCWK